MLPLQREHVFVGRLSRLSRDRAHLLHVHVVAERHHVVTDLLALGGAGSRYRVEALHVRIAVGDDDGDVGDARPVAVAGGERRG